MAETQTPVELFPSFVSSLYSVGTTGATQAWVESYAPSFGFVNAELATKATVGGDAPSVTYVLGTTNAQDFELITNGIAAETISHTTQNVTFTNEILAKELALNGATSGTLSILPAAVTVPYTLTMPAAQGGATTALTNDGAGNLSWAASGSSTFFKQSGNGFGAQAVLGTTDNNSLAIITDNTQALLVAANQAVTVASTLAIHGASCDIGQSGITTGFLQLETTGGTAATLTPNAAGSILTLGGSAIMAATGFAPGTLSTAATNQTVNMTVAAEQIQVATGVGGASITFVLPDARTLAVGATYTFNNNCTGSVFVQDNSTATQYTTPMGGYVTLILLTNGTAAGTWDTVIEVPANVRWGTTEMTVNGAFTFGTSASQALILETNNTTALTLSAAQIVTAANNLRVNGSSLTVGVGGTTTGSLILESAGSANAVTIAAPASGVTSYQTTWPATQGAAATTVVNNGSGVLTWGGAGSLGGFAQNGNAFGATAVFGTTDAHGIQIETAGSIAATFNTSQGVTFNGNVQALNGQLFTGQASGPVVGSLIMYSSAGTQLALSPGSGAGYTFSFPAAVPSAASGYFLTANTSSTTSWSNAPFIQGGNSYGADGLLGTNDAHGLNIYANNAGGTNPGLFIDTSQNVYSGFFSNFTVKSGVLAIGSQSLSTAAITLFNASNSNNVSITTPAVSTTYQITLPASLPAHAGYCLTTNNTTGATSWIAPAVANNPTQVSSGGTTSTTYVTTGIVCTITPQFTNSAILVTASFSISNSAGVNNAYATLTQQIASGTIVDLATGTAVGTVSKPFVSANVGGAFSVPATITFLAQPNTTSTVTYTVYMATGSGSDTVTVNANNVATICGIELPGGNVSTFMAGSARSPIRVAEPEDDFLDSVLL